ncbi:hypothetical protein CHS0354_000562 [Potamilus streckersoni]|uniref:Uncharacterized protein n=1 Tax=Potamilus streckersoni TaxID=2493646 RepID=A0AAE0T6Y0_9BIVA|nr:hypothetical protein CHS0354_000562 [Potamilus streckersoni]
MSSKTPKDKLAWSLAYLSTWILTSLTAATTKSSKKGVESKVESPLVSSVFFDQLKYEYETGQELRNVSPVPSILFTFFSNTTTDLIEEFKKTLILSEVLAVEKINNGTTSSVNELFQVQVKIDFTVDENGEKYILIKPEYALTHGGTYQLEYYERTFFNGTLEASLLTKKIITFKITTQKLLNDINPFLNTLYIIESYSGDNKRLGAAIDDNVMSSTYPVITITGFKEGTLVGFRFGKVEGAKHADADNKIEITKADVQSHGARSGDTLKLVVEGFVSPEVVYTPYEIRHWLDLQAMRKDLSGSYALQNNINFPNPENNGFPKDGFVPVGDELEKFKGSLQGNGFSINNLYIKNEKNVPTGLFGTVNTQISTGITNFLLKIDAIEGNATTGGVVGVLEKGTISNIGVTKGAGLLRIMSNGSNCGGVVGSISSESGIVESVYSTVHVIAQSSVAGGIAGVNSGHIKNCYSIGDVEAISYVGGIVGEQKATGKGIESCYTLSLVSPSNLTSSYGFAIGNYKDVSGLRSHLYRGTSNKIRIETRLDVLNLTTPEAEVHLGLTDIPTGFDEAYWQGTLEQFPTLKKVANPGSQTKFNVKGGIVQ